VTNGHVDTAVLIRYSRYRLLENHAAQTSSLTVKNVETARASSKNIVSAVIESEAEKRWLVRTGRRY